MKSVFKNPLNFTGKHLCCSLFNRVHPIRGKDTPTQVFSYEICGMGKNTYFEEHLRTAASNTACYFNTELTSNKGDSTNGFSVKYQRCI